MDRPFRATRFAALTGVSRERLRTWERRYGFPEPHRDRCRAAPLRAARTSSAWSPCAAPPRPACRSRGRSSARRYDEAPSHLASHIFAALVEHAPVPVAALSGPAPLRVEFVNGALRALPGAPRPGEELTTALPAFYDSPCVLALQQLFATAGGPTEAEHPAWGGDARQAARSALFRLPSEPDARPLVAMVGLEGEGERVARAALAELQREVEELRRRDERHTRWLDALALLAEEFRREPGRVGASTTGSTWSCATPTRSTPPSPSTSRGQLVVPTLAPRPARVQPDHRRRRIPSSRAACATASRRGSTPPRSAALGVPPDLHASAMPIVVAGEPLGLLVFVFAEVEPHDEDNGRLLTAVSAAMGFALLRDRLAQELREAAGAPDRRRGGGRRAQRVPPPTSFGVLVPPSRAPAGLSRRRLLARRGVGAQARDRLADDARDLHLRDADALADLGLREVLVEAQAQHLALARRDRAHEVLERRAVLGQREAVLLGAERVAEGVAAVVLAAARRLQRGGLVGARRLERLEHVLLVGADLGRDLRRPWAGDAGRATARRPRGRPSARAPAGRAARAPTTCGRGSSA